MNILIVGAGKLGLPLAKHLHAKGHSVTTLSRSPKDVPQGMTHICADVHTLTHEHLQGRFDWVYVILTPKERSLLGYQRAYVDSIAPLVAALGNHPVTRLIYVSSTQVYGQNAGEDINDDTPPHPSTAYGKILRAAELLWQAHFQDKLTIVRPSGLMADDRTFLTNLAINLTQSDEQHWLNLIHRDDVINILATLPSLDTLLDSYILSAHSMVRHTLLNAIRHQHNLPTIDISNNLPTTGKKLHATRLQHILDTNHITLTPIY